MAFIVQLKLIVGKPGSPRAGANARWYTLLVKGGHIVKIRDNIRTRVKHRVVFAAVGVVSRNRTGRGSHLDCSRSGRTRST